MYILIPCHFVKLHTYCHFVKLKALNGSIGLNKAIVKQFLKHFFFFALMEAERLYGMEIFKQRCISVNNLNHVLQ